MPIGCHAGWHKAGKLQPYPASPHYADQTALFSRKQWLPDRFCAAQIKADPNLTVTTVRS